MNEIFRKIGWNCTIVCMAGVAAVVCLGLAGCSSVDKLRGDGFHDNSMGDAVRESQPAPTKPREFWSFSNKARQIESDFPE